MPNTTLLLSREDVTSLLSIEDVLEATERVLRSHADGTVIMPAKVSVNLGNKDTWPHLNAFINAMPAYLGSRDVTGIKWAGGFWDNRAQGLSSVVALIVLTNPSDGSCLAILDGTWITAIRTAAVSAIATKHLATGPVSTVAFIGAGTQGRTHLLAFDVLFQPKEYRVYDVDRSILKEFVDDMSKETSAEVMACSSVEDAAKKADVVITATPARKPLLRGAWLEAANLVCSIGSYSELDWDVVEWCDRLIVDSREQTEHRGSLAPFFSSGELSPKDITGTLPDAVAGRLHRISEDKVNTLVVPIGMGSEDLAVAYVAYSRAQEIGVGLPFAFGSTEPFK